MKVTAFFTLLFFLLLSTYAMASDTKDAAEAKKPASDDKCPVCGMFVAKYPNWIAHIEYKDDTSVYFDGVKDMMKYLFDIKKYHPNKDKADISAVKVTDYYNVFLFNGHEAYYVIGSDISGPMGAELIPFKKESEAKEFMSDHKGKKILKFKDITPEVLEKL